MDIAGAQGNIIGGVLAAGNVIAGFSQYGIYESSSGTFDFSAITSNYIGINAAGTAVLGGGQDGIYLDHTADAFIGAGGEGNVIAGYSGAGLYLNASSGTVIHANFIGANAAGDATLGARSIRHLRHDPQPRLPRRRSCHTSRRQYHRRPRYR